MNRAAILPALLLSLALVASACGSDEPEPITKAEFVEQAEEICTDANAELEAEAEALGDAPTQEEIEGFASDVAVPNLQGQHDDIAALGAPEGEEDDVEAMLAALQDGLDAIEADPSLITSSDDPMGEASELAAELGLTECAG